MLEVFAEANSKDFFLGGGRAADISCFSTGCLFCVFEEVFLFDLVPTDFVPESK